MRWNCPHCGTGLAVSDDKLAASWSFSRCYKCAGYALIRRSDANLIKVDRAPEGEQILLPEAHEDPTATLSRNAAANLSRYMGSSSSKPSPSAPQIRPATRRGARPADPSRPAAAAPTPAQATRPAQTRAMPQSPTPMLTASPQLVPPAAPTPVAQARPTIPASPYRLSLPEPLPEEPVTSLRQRLMPLMIGLAGVLAICSGIYLYVEGQALRDRSDSPIADTASEAAPSVSGTQDKPHAPESSRSLAVSASRSVRAGSAAVDVDGLLDQVPSKAMAPRRSPDAATHDNIQPPAGDRH